MSIAPRPAGSLYDRYFEFEVKRRIANETAHWPRIGSWRVAAAQIDRGVQLAFALLSMCVGGLTASALFPLVLFFPLHTLLHDAESSSNLHIKLAATEFGLGSQALVLAVAAYALRRKAQHLFVARDLVAVLAFYPSPDQRLLWRKAPVWISFALYCAAAWAIATLPMFARETIDLGRIAVGSVFALLQGWHLLAIAIVVAQWCAPKSGSEFGRYAKVIAVTILVFAAAVALPGILPLFTSPEILRKIALVEFLLPTGWVSGALNYAVIEGKPIGWLFLAPAAVLWLHAALWLRRGYAIKELRLESTGGSEPVFERGLATARAKGGKKWRLFEKRSTIDARLPIEKRLSQDAALQPADWSSRWLPKRWIGERLTPRERTLVERFENAGSPSTFVLMGMAVGFVTCFVNSPIFDAIPVKIRLVIYFFLAAGPLQARGKRSLEPYWPIGLAETRLALRKTYARSGLLLLPFLAAVVALVGWSRPDRATYLPVQLAVVLAQVFALTEMNICERFASLIAPRPGIKRSRATMAFALTAALCVVALFQHHWAPSLALAVGIVALVRIGCKLFEESYTNEEVDFRPLQVKASP